MVELEFLALQLSAKKAHSNVRIQRILAKLVGHDMTLFWSEVKTNIVADTLSRAPVWPAPEPKDTLACTAWVAGAQEPHIDKFIIALQFKAEQDPNYKAIQKALIAKKDPNNIPRDYPAQAANVAWANLSLESDMPNLILFMGRIW